MCCSVLMKTFSIFAMIDSWFEHFAWITVSQICPKYLLSETCGYCFCCFLPSDNFIVKFGPRIMVLWFHLKLGDIYILNLLPREVHFLFKRLGHKRTIPSGGGKGVCHFHNCSLAGLIDNLVPRLPRWSAVFHGSSHRLCDLLHPLPRLFSDVYSPLLFHYFH